jgi:hypothetical protein
MGVSVILHVIFWIHEGTTHMKKKFSLFFFGRHILLIPLFGPAGVRFANIWAELSEIYVFRLFYLSIRKIDPLRGKFSYFLKV